MSLIQAPKGENMLVVRVAADDKTRRHLENLGIMSGAELTPLTCGTGNLIVRVRDSRIAIDSGLAESIIVRRAPQFA